MHWVKHHIEDPWAGLGSLCYSTAQETSSAYAKTVSHDQEGASIHSPEQGDVRFREPLGLEHVKGRFMIYSVKGIDDVQIQEDRQTCHVSALLCQYAVQLAKLALSTTTSVEPFLCIINQLIILCGVVQSLVNYFEEERELCAGARNWSKLWHQ